MNCLNDAHVWVSDRFNSQLKCDYSLDLTEEVILAIEERNMLSRVYRNSQNQSRTEHIFQQTLFKAHWSSF